MATIHILLPLVGEARVRKNKDLTATGMYFCRGEEGGRKFPDGTVITTTPVHHPVIDDAGNTIALITQNTEYSLV